MMDGTLVGCFWHRSAIPIPRASFYLRGRAVLGEGCPGVPDSKESGRSLILRRKLFHPDPCCPDKFTAPQSSHFAKII